MPGDFVGAHQFDKIPLGVARQGRFAKMGIAGQEIAGVAIEIGEIAAPATGNADFLAGLFGVIDNQGASTALRCAH